MTDAASQAGDSYNYLVPGHNRVLGLIYVNCIAFLFTHFGISFSTPSSNYSVCSVMKGSRYSMHIVFRLMYATSIHVRVLELTGMRHTKTMYAYLIDSSKLFVLISGFYVYMKVHFPKS